VGIFLQIPRIIVGFLLRLDTDTEVGELWWSRSESLEVRLQILRVGEGYRIFSDLALAYVQIKSLLELIGTHQKIC
jgi:hypothetical protein